MKKTALYDSWFSCSGTNCLREAEDAEAEGSCGQVVASCTAIWDHDVHVEHLKLSKNMKFGADCSNHLRDIGIFVEFKMGKLWSSKSKIVKDSSIETNLTWYLQSIEMDCPRSIQLNRKRRVVANFIYKSMLCFFIYKSMFWMMLQSRRVHWDNQDDVNRIPLWFLVLLQWHKLFEVSKRGRSWRLMSTSSCELCRDLRPWCICRAPQTELAREVWCWLFKPFGRSRHFWWI